MLENSEIVFFLSSLFWIKATLYKIYHTSLFPRLESDIMSKRQFK